MTMQPLGTQAPWWIHGSRCPLHELRRRRRRTALASHVRLTDRADSAGIRRAPAGQQTDPDLRIRTLADWPDTPLWSTDL